MRRAHVFLSCMACQALAGISPDPHLDDSGTDAGLDSSDASMGRCDPLAPFGAPVPIDELNTTATELGLRLTPDEHTAYFTRSTSSNIVNGAQIYVAVRGAEKFGTPMLLPPEVNDASTVGSLNPYPLGSDLFFDTYRDRSGAGNFTRAIWQVTLSPIGTPALVPVGHADEYFEAYVLPDAMYFTSHKQLPMYKGLTFNLYRAARVDGAVTTVSALDEIDTDQANERSPVVTPDELRIYWASAVGNASDIWTASRTTAKSPFSNAHVVTELGQMKFQYPTWISPDGCALYLMRDYDLYVARK